MNRSISLLGALALSLTMFACSGGVGHGARPAPGPEAFPGHVEPQLAKRGVTPAPAPESTVQEASR